MRFTEMHNRLVERETPAKLLGVIAYDEEDEFFYCEDGTIGVVFDCHPLVGVNPSKATQFQVLFQQDMPPNTLIQITMWTSPDIGTTVYHMNSMRRVKPGEKVSPARERAASVVNHRGAFLKRHTERPISERNPMRIRDVHVYVTVMFPCRTLTPTDRDKEWFGRIRRNTQSVLETIGMAPRALQPEGYIRALSSMVNWGETAAWRTPVVIYDPEVPIRDQVFDSDSALRVSERSLQLGCKHAKCLSVKRLPEHLHLGQPAQFLSDAKTGTRGVRHPVLITTNILFPAADEERAKADQKKAWATRVAAGGLARFVSLLRKQKESRGTRSVQRLTTATGSSRRTPPSSCSATAKRTSSRLPRAWRRITRSSATGFRRTSLSASRSCSTPCRCARRRARRRTWRATARWPRATSPRCCRR